MAKQIRHTLAQHRTSLCLVADCLAALALMFFLTIAKDLRERQVLESDLADASRRADMQKLLAPLQAQLQGDSEASIPAIAAGVDISPSDAEISADRYESIFGRIISQCGLEQVALAPDIQSILSDTGQIQVDMTVRGAFPDLRRLMLTMARLPFLSGIETFRMNRSTDSDGLEMSLKLRLQLSSTEYGTS